MNNEELAGAIDSTYSLICRSGTATPMYAALNKHLEALLSVREERAKFATPPAGSAQPAALEEPWARGGTKNAKNEAPFCSAPRRPGGGPTSHGQLSNELL